MNILVTGGYGCLGSSFLHYIHTKPEINTIVNIDRVLNHENVKNAPRGPKIRHFTTNINNVDMVDNILYIHNITHVVNFANLSDGDVMSTNVIDLNIFLNICKKKDLQRFHHISTCDIYGASNTVKTRAAESSPYITQSLYTASKAASNLIVSAYGKDNNMPVSISNCCNLFESLPTLNAFVQKNIDDILHNNKLTACSAGVYEWLDVADHNAAVWSILTDEKCANNTYNINGFIFTQQMVRDMLFALLGDSTDEVTSLSINNKLYQTLDWQPAIALQSFLQQSIDTYWSSVEA